MDFKKIGGFGENIACYFLKGKGYKILDRNYYKEWSSVSKGEIDIIVWKDKTVSFVEVKTQTNPAESGVGFSPEERVDFQKQRKLIKLAQYWLRDHKIPLDSKWQIDIVSVIINQNSKKAKIRHFQNAVS